MSEAYVVEAVRTAVGKRNGSLAGVHPIDLGARVFQGLSVSMSTPVWSTTRSWAVWTLSAGRPATSAG